MTERDGQLEAGAQDALLALTLWCANPAALGVLVLRGPPCPARDQLLASLPELLPRSAPIVTLPLGVTEDRLLGGVALAETLRAGHVVRTRGLLQEAHRGIVIARMAERMAPHVAAHLAGALDHGAIAVEREGASAIAQARLGVVALDESVDDDDHQLPPALLDRASFCIDLRKLGRAAAGLEQPEATRSRAASSRAALVAVPGSMLEALVAAAAAFGIHGVRAALLAVAATRTHAALRGQTVAAPEDAEVAARLVLAWRARSLPSSSDESAEQATDGDPLDADAAPPATPPPDTTSGEPADTPPPTSASEIDEPHTDERCTDADPPGMERVAPVDELLVDAIKSGIQPGLLAQLQAGATHARGPQRAGRVGAIRAALHGGRPAGVRARAPRDGERLHVLETIRAAAPWQPLRRGHAPPRAAGERQRLRVRAEDFRVVKHQQRAESCVIFCVDASGSSALQRLAEAKGAIEHVLLDCYARRDHVALIAFRANAATTVLPPTRSLARVRKSLAALTGGGATPLAAGIDAARALAVDVARRGQSPIIVLMTDGRGNVAPDGTTGAVAATRAAQESARAVRCDQVPTLFLDTAPRPREQSRALARIMDAQYMPLPLLDGAGIARQVKAMARASQAGPARHASGTGARSVAP